jgi:beta-mannosidase
MVALKVEGDEITVTASAYAKSVYIYNKKDDLILSDNFFDMNKGTKTVKILSGEATDLEVKTVFDIR